MPDEATPLPPEDAPRRRRARTAPPPVEAADDDDAILDLDSRVGSIEAELGRRAAPATVEREEAAAPSWLWIVIAVVAVGALLLWDRVRSGRAAAPQETVAS